MNKLVIIGSKSALALVAQSDNIDLEALKSAKRLNLLQHVCRQNMEVREVA